MYIVPPSDDVIDEYRGMLHHKDKRLVFTEEMWKHLILSRGFRLHASFPFWIKGFNVREWLRNSGLDELTRMELWNRHINGSKEFKEASRMVIMDEAICEKKGIVHCHIDLKNIIIVGEKI